MNDELLKWQMTRAILAENKKTQTSCPGDLDFMVVPNVGSVSVPNLDLVPVPNPTPPKQSSTYLSPRWVKIVLVVGAFLAIGCVNVFGKLVQKRFQEQEQTVKCQIGREW